MEKLPKEYAQELVDEMHKVESKQGLFNMTIHEAKQCAKIAVDKILNYDIRAKCESQFVIEQRITEYFEQVKTEIENL